MTIGDPDDSCCREPLETVEEGVGGFEEGVQEMKHFGPLDGLEADDGLWTKLALDDTTVSAEAVAVFEVGDGIPVNASTRR